MSAITLGRPMSDVITLGASPRVHLLPPEVIQGKKERAVRRRLLAALVIVVVMVVLATGVAVVSLAGSAAQLASEQARSALLSAQRAKLGEVTTLQSQVDGITAAQPIAADGQILWEPYLTAVGDTLPAGMTITGFSAQLDGAAADASADTTTVKHAAILTITADSPQAPISDWLDNLASVPGFLGAMPGSVTLVPDTGRYTVAVSLLIGDKALAKQFDAKKK
ncbi:hypothetical protein [Lacisediminihabitans changchengi]|uniref:Fimbrial assembly protein n=1 Tax=Lacisediminihabitans changchengi TaxID=2787634 RepID=A0A934SN76_9MICO|nr:hypothetical protein [Lacisediminihabitans changchengi]MBK4348414.1 hypothetical protein [Lacisediminihabitans changchengi]